MPGTNVFTDRTEAGRRLAAELRALTLERPVVFALPRGGVPVAIEVAAALRAPLEVLLVRKIGAPGEPELAVGGVVDGDEPEVVVNQRIAAATGAGPAYIRAEVEHQLREIARRRAVYATDHPPVDPRGRDALVVDDGIATGASVRVAVRALRRRGARRVIVAAPVATREMAERLRREADEVVCVLTPRWIGGVSAVYRDFHQLSDDEVVGMLAAGGGRA